MIVFNLAFPPIVPLNLALTSPKKPAHTPSQIYPLFSPLFHPNSFFGLILTNRPFFTIESTSHGGWRGYHTAGFAHR